MRIENPNINGLNRMNSELNESDVSNKLFGSEDTQTENLKSNVFYLNFEYSRSEMLSSQKIVHEYEDTMETKDKALKQVLEKVLERFYGEGSTVPVYPKQKTEDIDTSKVNPYNDSSNSSGMVVDVMHEYYRKETIDFSTSLTIQTPNQTFQMDISISITEELYISQSSKYDFSDKSLFEPFVMNHDEDVNPFGDLKSLDFIFDMDDDGGNDIMELLEKSMKFFNVHNEDENKDMISDKFSIWAKDNEGGDNLVSIVDLNENNAFYLSSFQSTISYEKTTLNMEKVVDITA